jgi:hypothetical protein
LQKSNKQVLTVYDSLRRTPACLAFRRRPGLTELLITITRKLQSENSQASQAGFCNKKVSNNILKFNSLIIHAAKWAILVSNCVARCKWKMATKESDTESATSGTLTGGSDTESGDEATWNMPGGGHPVSAEPPRATAGPSQGSQSGARASGSSQLTSYRGYKAKPRARTLPVGIKPREIRQMEGCPKNSAKAPKRVLTMEQLATGKTVKEILGALKPLPRSKVKRLKVRHNPGPNIKDLLKTMDKLHRPGNQGKKKPKGSINVPRKRVSRPAAAATARPKSPKKKVTTFRKKFSLTDSESEVETVPQNKLAEWLEREQHRSSQARQAEEALQNMHQAPVFWTRTITLQKLAQLA